VDVPATGTPREDAPLPAVHKRHYVFAAIVALLGGALGADLRGGGEAARRVHRADPLASSVAQPAFHSAAGGWSWSRVRDSRDHRVRHDVDNPSAAFVTFQFTVTPALHTIASFIVGLGISYKVIDWAQGRAPLPKSSRHFYIAAVVLHGLYITAVVALALIEVLDFD